MSSPMTEWGTMENHYDHVFPASEATAKRRAKRAGVTLVKRTVTEWKEANE